MKNPQLKTTCSLHNLTALQPEECHGWRQYIEALYNKLARACSLLCKYRQYLPNLFELSYCRTDRSYLHSVFKLHERSVGLYMFPDRITGLTLLQTLNIIHFHSLTIFNDTRASTVHNYLFNFSYFTSQGTPGLQYANFFAPIRRQCMREKTDSYCWNYNIDQSSC